MDEREATPHGDEPISSRDPAQDFALAESSEPGPFDAVSPPDGFGAGSGSHPPMAEQIQGQGDTPAAAPLRRRRGAGLAWKIALLTLVPLFLLAALTAFFAYRTLQSVLHEEFRDKGQAIATGLSNAAVGSLVRGDAATLQAQVDAAAQAQGVAYILITREDGSPLVHTFAPTVPRELLGEGRGLVAANDELTYLDPETSAPRRVLEIGQPILTDQRLRVRVGMDLDRVERQTREAALNVGTIGALSLLLAWLAALAVARRTVRPIQELVGVAEKVGEGDLSDLAPVRSRDEIGMLAETFNDTIRRLRDLVQTEEERDLLQRQIHEFHAVATDISRGDLTRRGQSTQGALGEVVVAINAMVSEISELLRSARGAADTVGEGSLDMIEKTQRMVAGSQAQARDAVRVSNQMGQVSGAIRSVSESAVLSAEAARQTLAAAETGQRSVQASLDGMMRARTEVQTLATRVESLAERSQEISEVVETIATIASQTNLLALNAAIEASGAGEAGARFTVVADEVRRLAEHSAHASGRIGRMISSVQSEVEDARAAMAAGTREVESGFQVASAAGEQLQEIAQISGRSAHLATQISDAVSGQVEGVEKVSAALRSIAEVAAETEASVLDGRRVAEQLRQLAERLDQALARFRLD